MNYLDCKRLKRDIQKQRLKVADLRDSAVRISPVLSDMPHAQQNDSKVEKAVESLTMEQLGLESMEHRLRAMIDSIPDEFMREIYSQRIHRGRTWQWIAMHIEGHNSADSIRKMCHRYKW